MSTSETSLGEAIAAAVTSSLPDDARRQGQLLRSFLLLQQRRAAAYAEMHQGFRTFMDERETWEAEEAVVLEKRAKDSTVMTRSTDAKATTPATENKPSISTASILPPGTQSAATAEDHETLESISAANEADRRSKANPEQVFQKLCAKVMIEFQAVSKDVREVVARLAAAPETTARHFAALLASLQQLEKLKLELTVHQQMLLNQRYVLMHPRAHGQLQEHQHHVHGCTDAHGRVCGAEHAHSHGNPFGGGGGLGSVDEEQEFADNAQPFTRHLSALLSDTAFQTDSPFLFPPSGAAPTLTDSSTFLDATPASPHSTHHPHLSETVQEEHVAKMSELREQEGEVVEKINEMIEEIRMEVMEDEDAEDDLESTE